MKDFDLRSGLTIPMRLADSGAMGGMGLWTDASRKEFKARMNETNHIAVSAALYAASRLRKLLRDEESRAAKLTARERECLNWLSKGLQSEQIADRLNISRITVDVHIGRAKRKLGAATREQALVFAIQKGIVEP